MERCTAMKIEEIMNMLNCSDTQIQEQGMLYANQVSELDVFFHSMQIVNSSRVKKNCAKVLANKTDSELEPYIDKMLEWLQDINWTGAYIILDRLKVFSGKMLSAKYIATVEETIEKAKKCDEYSLMWLDYLSGLLDNEELKAALPMEMLAILQKHYDKWSWWYDDENDRIVL